MKVGSEPKAQQHEEAAPPADVESAAPKDKGEPTAEPKGPSPAKDEFQDAPAASGPDLQGGGGGSQPQAMALEAPARTQGTNIPDLERIDAEARRELEKTEAGRGVLDDWKALQANGGFTLEQADLHGQAAAQWGEGDRKMEIDPAYVKTTGDYIELLTHETTHASQSDKLHPERDGVNRPADSFENAEAYADQRVEEEVRAQARTYDVLHESKIESRFYPEIQKGYDEAVAQGGREAGLKYLREKVNSDQLFPGTRSSSTQWWDEKIAPIKQQRAAG